MVQDNCQPSYHKNTAKSKIHCGENSNIILKIREEEHTTTQQNFIRITSVVLLVQCTNRTPRVTQTTSLSQVYYHLRKNMRPSDKTYTHVNRTRERWTTTIKKIPHFPVFIMQKHAELQTNTISLTGLNFCKNIKLTVRLGNLLQRAGWTRTM